MHEHFSIIRGHVRAAPTGPTVYAYVTLSHIANTNESRIHSTVLYRTLELFASITLL